MQVPAETMLSNRSKVYQWRIGVYFGAENAKTPSETSRPRGRIKNWMRLYRAGQQKKMEVSSGSLLHLGATLANLQSWIALANHVDTAASTNYFAVFAAVFQASNRANHFHRRLLDPMRFAFHAVSWSPKFDRATCRGRAGNSPKYPTCQAIAATHPPRNPSASPLI